MFISVLDLFKVGIVSSKLQIMKRHYRLQMTQNLDLFQELLLSLSQEQVTLEGMQKVAALW